MPTAESATTDDSTPVRPPLSSYSDWPYKVRPFPALTLIRYGGLSKIKPRAEAPERVE
jgi:hypothetical protein